MVHARSHEGARRTLNAVARWRLAFCYALSILLRAGVGYAAVGDHADKVSGYQYAYEQAANSVGAILRFFDQHNGSVGAAAGVAVAVFTWRLIVVGRDQHKASMNAIALAREEFIASHRPRLHIRTIYNLPLSLDSPITAQVVLVNRGDTTATIETVRAQIFIKGEGVVPDDDVVIDGAAPHYDRRILTGEDRIHAVRSKELRRAISVTDEVSILGQIVYRDDNLIVRRTGFLWRLDFASRKFEPVEDRARNYED